MCKKCGYEHNGQCGGRYLYNKAKGGMAEEIVFQLFKAVNIPLIPFGIEKQFAYLLDKKNTPAILNKMPDFLTSTDTLRSSISM